MEITDTRPSDLSLGTRDKVFSSCMNYINKIQIDFLDKIHNLPNEQGHKIRASIESLHQKETLFNIGLVIEVSLTD